MEEATVLAQVELAVVAGPAAAAASPVAARTAAAAVRTAEGWAGPLVVGTTEAVVAHSREAV